MSGPGNAPYKRSWKNLLINKQYQLRFTLFMVGLAALLMALLGWWVIGVAGEATWVAQSLRRGEPCPAAPTSMYLVDDEAATGPAAPSAPTAAPTPTPTPDLSAPTPTPDPSAPTPTPDPSAPAADPSAPTPAADPSAPAADPSAPAADPSAPAADPTGEPGDAPRRTVVVHESTLTMETPPPPPPPRADPNYATKVAAHHQCELARQAAIDELGRGKTRIVLVLVASGLVLLVGLAVFGIKMTHRVAGPLYKVTLYFAKLRDGRYDKVTPLRKGDQLVEFFDHFKQAHAGVVDLERADVAAVKAALAAAEADGSLARSPELAAAAAALREVLARKEQSLG
ncbi:MAG: hypothetical protein KBG48_16245 [Kofleriaceae bacterium]|nr:hypothetical protein [Kofleriaceae bacterium]MBP9168950.1 hypothetical protein [Kofleriaceae bacterium]